MLLHYLAELVGGYHARLPPELLALVEQQERWNSLYPVLLGHRWVLVHVNLDHPQFALVLPRHLLQDWRHGFAGATPIGVKVYQHWHARTVDDFLERFLGHGRFKVVPASIRKKAVFDGKSQF